MSVDSALHLQLQRVWPAYALDQPLVVHVPAGYHLRTYLPGDELRFYEVMALAGWPGHRDSVPGPDS